MRDAGEGRPEDPGEGVYVGCKGREDSQMRNSAAVDECVKDDAPTE